MENCVVVVKDVTNLPPVVEVDNKIFKVRIS